MVSISERSPAKAVKVNTEASRTVENRFMGRVDGLVDEPRKVKRCVSTRGKGGQCRRGRRPRADWRRGAKLERGCGTATVPSRPRRGHLQKV